MIILLVGGWVGFLWILVKVGVLKKWHSWMKISPVVIGVIAFLAIFLPLNWNAPSGAASVTVGSVSVRPSVSGQVTEILATSWERLEKGDPILEIDKTRYLAAFRQAEAKLNLAREQLARKEALLKGSTVSVAEVDVFRAEVEIAEAAVSAARLDLENTTIRAPFAGIVPGLTVLPGYEVTAGTPILAFLDIERPIVSLILGQNQIRNVKTGQKAEVTFRSQPGKTFEGTVLKVYLSAPHAEYVLDGQTPDVPEIRDTSYVVVIDIGDAVHALPPGATGMGAVYTDKGNKFFVVQQLTVRMNAWMNFF